MYPTYQPQMTPYQYPYSGFYNPAPAPTSVSQPQNNTPVNTAPSIKLDTVSGRTAADVYNVNMGEEAILIDIDNPYVYKKVRSLDNKLTCQIYDLVPHVEEVAPIAPAINLEEYVKQDAIDQIIVDKVKEEVDKRLSEISFAPKTTRKAKVVEVEE